MSSSTRTSHPPGWPDRADATDGATRRTVAPAWHAWFTLARVQTAGLTAVAPVLGALAASPAQPMPRLLALFALGAMAHVFGFILNEIADTDLDRRAPHARAKPLVSGAISRRAALIAALAQPPLAFGLGRVGLHAGPAALEALLVSVLLATAYDLGGKRCPVPPLADAALGGSIALLVIFGALVSGGLTGLAVALAGLSALQVVFNNGVEGGLKDLAADRVSGANNTALWLGAGDGPQGVRPSPRLKIYALGLKIAAWALAGWAAIAQGSPAGWIVAALAGSAAALTLLPLFRAVPDRRALLRAFSRHEIATYTLAVAVVAPRIGLLAAAGILALPIVWFVAANWALTGRPLEPGV